MARDILAALEDRVLVCEGAMGSLLVAYGVVGRSSAEANLTHPEAVARVHRDYQAAGAEVFQTNTFAASLPMLARAGLEGEATRIWTEAGRLCREAVGPEAWVAACGGPTGHLLQPLGTMAAGEAQAAYRQQFEAMLGPAVDFVLLEGFEALEEVEAAVRGVRQVDGQVPVAVTLSFSSPTGRTSMGVSGQAAAARLSELKVQIVGAGCGHPAGLELALQEMAQATDRPLMAQANAGVPELVNQETRWGVSPRELGQQAARLIGYGARIVGGCCGTTPDHIRQVARAARAAA